jgi:hypothetical protein
MLERLALSRERQEINASPGNLVEPDVARRRRHSPRQDDALDVRIRQRSQENRVDDAEDGRAGTDAERQREHGVHGERRILPQHAGGVAEIVRDGVHQADAPRVAAVFADLLEAAELEVGAAPGLVPSQAGLLVLPGLRLEMRAQFLVQIRVDGGALQQRSRPKQEIGEHTPPCAC